MGIKLPIATDRTQGQRTNDFTFTTLGELVYPGYVCARDEAEPDGGCGCGRAFTGLRTHKPTTTALIREVELTVEELTEAVRASYISAGFLMEAEPDGDGMVGATVRIMLEIGEGFPAGTVIERRLDELRARGSDLKLEPTGRHLRSVPNPRRNPMTSTTAEPSAPLQWVADGPVMPNSGTVGGDGAGDSFSVRYTCADKPGAIITSYWYPVDESERYGDDPDDPDARSGWDVENQVEYLICENPSDPGGTEVWSQYITRNPNEMGFETEADAIANAQRQANSESAEHYDWNGQAFF